GVDCARPSRAGRAGCLTFATTSGRELPGPGVERIPAMIAARALPSRISGTLAVCLLAVAGLACGQPNVSGGNGVTPARPGAGGSSGGGSTGGRGGDPGGSGSGGTGNVGGGIVLPDAGVGGNADMAVARAKP